MKNLSFFKMFGVAFVLQFFITNIMAWFLYSQIMWQKPAVLVPYLLFNVGIIIFSTIFTFVYKPGTKRYVVYFAIIVITMLFVLMININALSYGEDFTSLALINLLLAFFIVLSINKPTKGALYGIVLLLLSFLVGILTQSAFFLEIIFLYFIIVYPLSLLIGKRINRNTDLGVNNY